jgi:creatinine amidohydrolase/Fe(II)-dependent formamide hydrolase-like protein
MMLYLRPDLVDSTVARRHKPEPNPYPDITMPLDGRIALPEGMHGDTSAASAEKGRELFERMANRICQFIENWP